MKQRYRADRELIGERDTPVVTDRRYGSDKVICFPVGMFMARRIAAALNHYEQRRLALKFGNVDHSAQRSERLKIRSAAP